MPRKLSHKSLASKNFERFHARRASKITGVEFTMPKALTFLGEGHAVEYHSNKSNGPHGQKRTLYRHKFGKGVKIYLHPNKKWILVGGGNFRVTDWMRD